MKTGEVIREFVAKDGRRVILRTLKWEDLDDLLDFINSLVEEGANILRTEKVSRDEEIGFLTFSNFWRKVKSSVWLLK
ncbi:MAG: hypothetical protein QXJ07_03090 [Candidatus Bathyarchaeia archaeon]